jgi:hypothetical protein
VAKIFLALFFSIVAAHSQEIIPGLIPRFYSLEAATDLSISPEIAHEQALAGADISLLAPDESSNIWKNEAKEIPQLDLLEGKRNVRFIKELPSRSGQIRFTVVTDDQRELIVVLSKKVHNFLLRRNILAKLGYETQPMSWASNLNLTFESTIDRDLFIEEMKDKLLAGTERWIVKQDGLEMMLQDALVLAPEADIYNLALGVIEF